MANTINPTDKANEKQTTLTKPTTPAVETQIESNTPLQPTKAPITPTQPTKTDLAKAPTTPTQDKPDSSDKATDAKVTDTKTAAVTDEDKTAKSTVQKNLLMLEARTTTRQPNPMY